MSKFFNLINTLISKVNNSVKVEPQTFTEEQKSQARTNLGVPTKSSELQNDSNYVTKWYVTFGYESAEENEHGNHWYKGTCDRTFDEISVAIQDPTKQVVGCWMGEESTAIYGKDSSPIRFCFSLPIIHSSYNSCIDIWDDNTVRIQEWEDTQKTPIWWYSDKLNLGNRGIIPVDFYIKDIESLEEELNKSIFGNIHLYTLSMLFDYNRSFASANNRSVAIDTLQLLVDRGVIGTPSITYTYNPCQTHLDVSMIEEDYETVNVYLADDGNLIVKLLNSTVRHSVMDISSVTDAEPIAYLDIETNKIIRQHISPFYWETDSTLSKNGYAADAESVGVAIHTLNEKLPYIITGKYTSTYDSTDGEYEITYDVQELKSMYENGCPIVLRVDDVDGVAMEFSLCRALNLVGSYVFMYREETLIHCVYLHDGCVEDYGSTDISNYFFSKNNVYTGIDLINNVSKTQVPSNYSINTLLGNMHKFIRVSKIQDSEEYTLPVTFAALKNQISKGYQITLLFTDSDQHVVQVPLLYDSTTVVDGVEYYYYALVYPGLTEDTWSNTYRVFISVNSNNQVVVKQDVASNS